MDVGVIGVGVMGQNHVRVYSELKQVDSVSVYDINTNLAESVAEAHGASVCPSLGSLLREVDAVSLCIPTPLHAEIAAGVMGAGVHLLIEKPMAATAREARSLLGAIPDDLVVGVGHIERFNPVIEEIRRISSKPLLISIRRHNPASSRVVGTGVVEDLMIHDIDLAAHVFCGDVRLISAAGGGDIAVALLDGAGVPVSLSASRKASRKIRSIYIEEENATIEGDLMSQEVYIYWKPEEYRMDHGRYLQENVIEKVLVNRQEPLKRELSTFLECVRTGREFPVTPADAVEDLLLCEEISRAQGSRR
ncbi:MAG: Gfo/Idh/MocA family oxidoreductase [Methanoculleaceae archaeon]